VIRLEVDVPQPDGLGLARPLDATSCTADRCIFGGAGERLVMRHDPGGTPDPYVAGTLLAIRKAADVPGVRRGLDSLLIDPSTGP